MDEKMKVLSFYPERGVPMRRYHLSAISDDRFVIIWDSDSQNGAGQGIFAQRFQSDGTKVYK
jgi:hypothetical protein